MSEAGKDAQAREQVASGDTAAVRTLSRFSPQSAQLAKDHALLAKSVWCGVVFSLALMITVVNLLPPVNVGYLVSTQVLASPRRLAMLKQHLKSSSDAVPPARLVSVKVLDGERSKSSDPQATDKGQLVLLEVASAWPERTTTGKVHKWLDQLTQIDERTLLQVDSARAQRFARWEVQAQQHYLNHYRHIRGTQSPPTEDTASENATKPLQLTGSSDRVPMKFASLAATTASADSTLPTETLDLEKQLEQAVESVIHRERDAAANLQSQASKFAGVLTLSGAPRVHAAPARVGGPMVLSMLILGLAGGAIGGWVNHRAHSGGVFCPDEVGVSLQMVGLPLLGVLPIPTHESFRVDRKLSGQWNGLRRSAVQRSLAACELVLMFWCLAIAIRLVLDPLWRALVWESPLAGLSRLFVGLP